MNGRPFTAYGQPLALAPQAFGVVVAPRHEPPRHRMIDGVAVVDVTGPLANRLDPCADSYEALVSRVGTALAESPRAIVLSFDSPGGVVSGMFDAASSIRSMCAEAGVLLVAHVTGQATSAAYALACVASSIYVSPTGIVGSIGCIGALVDQTALDGAMGMRYSLVTSGARKADGNPHSVTTDAAIAAMQVTIDASASAFVDHVTANRRITRAEVVGLEAGIVQGRAAVAAGLADGVATINEVLALVRSGADVAAASAQATTEGTTNMDENEKAYRASLQAVLDDEKSDEKAKAKAKAVLAAMDGDSDEGEKKPEKSDDDTEAKAEVDEKKPDETNAIAALATHTGSVEARLAVIEKAYESEQRKALRASRADVSAGIHDALGGLSLAAYRDALAKIEKPKTPKPAATATVAATRGDGQGARDDARVSTNSVMARAMGLAVDDRVGVKRTDNTITFYARHADASKAG